MSTRKCTVAAVILQEYQLQSKSTYMITAIISTLTLPMGVMHCDCNHYTIILKILVCGNEPLHGKYMQRLLHVMLMHIMLVAVNL